MRDSEAILYSLSKNAQKEEYEFYKIYRILYNKDLYYKAISKIYKNQGSGTKGTDNETIDGFNEAQIEDIIADLREERYQPRPVKRIYIPKRNGKLRPLGIPTFRDRLVQEVCRVILNAIYEPVFSEVSYGFRENRSCHTALKDIDANFRSVSWFIEGDIEGFFDNIDHKILTDILRKRIKDEKFIRLIWKFLRTGYVEIWKYNKTYSGTPQGGIVSPILANIYLNELDKYVERIIKPEFDIGKPKQKKRNTKYRMYEARNGRLSKKIDSELDLIKSQELIEQYKENKKVMLSLPYYESHAGNVKSVKYVRYADDFIIGVIGSKQDCTTIREKIKVFLEENLKLKLSDEKTLITHSSDTAKFLGYHIKVSNAQLTQRDKNGCNKRMFNRSIQLLIPDGTIERVILDKKMVKDIDAKEWDILHRPSLTGLTDLEIVMTFNDELRGLYNYYCMAENVSVKMWQLRYVMEYSCLKTLANKYKTHISKLKDKYRIGKLWGIKYETKKGVNQVILVNEFKKDRKPKYQKDVDIKPNATIYMGVTELEKRLKANKCELCGAENVPIELHHVNKVKNLKGKEFWEKVMIAKRRKTLMVCKNCHNEIHHNN